MYVKSEWSNEITTCKQTLPYHRKIYFVVSEEEKNVERKTVSRCLRNIE